MEQLIDTIIRLEAKNKSLNITPTYVLFKELQAERIRLLREELNVMVKAGTISVARTLNDKAISVNRGE
jgi:hypothetical protein